MARSLQPVVCSLPAATCWIARLASPRSLISSRPEPIELALDQQHPRHLAINASHLYWINASGGTLVRVALGDLGSARVETVASGIANPGGLALSSDHAYWTDFTTGDIMRWPLAGGTPSAVRSGEPKPLRVTVDTTSVYWTNADTNAVMRADLDGSNAVGVDVGEAARDGYAVECARGLTRGPALVGLVVLVLRLLLERMVLEGDAERAPRPGHHPGRFQPRLDPPFEPPHPGLVSPCEPAQERLPGRRRLQPRHPGAVEARFERPGLEEVGGSGGRAGVHGRG